MALADIPKPTLSTASFLFQKICSEKFVLSAFSYGLTHF